MAHTLTDRTVALAGLFQAAKLVQQTARQGHAPDALVAPLVGAIFNTNPADVPSVFGGLENLRLGLRTLADQLGTDNQRRDFEITKYAIALLQLESQLRKRPPMLEQITQGVTRARQQAEHFASATHASVLASLGGLYSDTLSTLAPRIMVAGEPMHLNNPDHANKIRTLLLAGLRAAVLWRQCGGVRWQLFLNRGKHVAQAELLLTQLRTT